MGGSLYYKLVVEVLQIINL